MPDPKAPYPEPLTGPQPWLSLVDSGQGAEGEEQPEAPFPGEHWPEVETIDYISKLIILVLLLLALPWLVERLLTHPAGLSHKSADLLGSAATGA